MWLVYLYKSQALFSLLLSQSKVSTTSPVEEITAGLSARYTKQLHSISVGNSVIIVEYIGAMKSEVNLSDHYRRDVIVTLYRFSKFSNDKPFKDSTRSDVIAFLEQARVGGSFTQMDRHLQHL
jgi:hypothetical protein